MGRVTDISTLRLLLRQWRPEDRGPFAELNADPDVMEWFPAPLERAVSDEFADRIETRIAEQGWGLWAVEVVGGAPFIGFVGLWPAGLDAHFTPAVEVGWRLAKPHWGHGYATEAGRRAIEFGLVELGLAEIVSYTTAGNRRSRAVMERLGMVRDPADDFDHPRLPQGHPLRPHVLYRTR